MKNFLMLVLAFAIVWVVWKIVVSFIVGTLGTIISIGMLILFCYLVYALYKALTRQKI